MDVPWKKKKLKLSAVPNLSECKSENKENINFECEHQVTNILYHTSVEQRVTEGGVQCVPHTQQMRKVREKQKSTRTSYLEFKCF